MSTDKEKTKRRTFSDTLKYIDDYKIEEETDKRGRVHKKAVYIGPYIRIFEDKKVLVKKLIAVDCLAVLLTACLLVAVFIEHASVWWGGVSIPLALSLFPTFYLLMGLFRLPYKEQQLKRDTYMHGIIRIFRSAGAILPLVGITLPAELVYRLIYKDSLLLPGDILFLILIVVVLIAVVGVIILLRSIDVDESALNS